MSEEQLVRQFHPAFSRFLSGVGGSIRSSVDQYRRGQAKPDLIVETEIRGKRKTLLVEVKALGQPRYIRQAIEQLKACAAKIPNSYPMVVAPYITEQTARIIEENRLGYFDLAGNCLLDFEGIFIRSRGNPNPNPVTRQLKSLFQPRSSRIIRVMLTGETRGGTATGNNDWTVRWTVQELVRKAQVSLGLASAVKRKLLDFEYAKEENRRLILTKPGELLDEWARNYSLETNRRVGLYSMYQDVLALEDDLAGRFPRGTAVTGGYAFTSFSGARRIAPFVRYASATVYFSRPIEELKNQLNAKEVPTGANLNVLLPYDEGVFYGSRQVRGACVVGAVQLYLDLITEKGRGEEAAQAIRERELMY